MLVICRLVQRDCDGPASLPVASVSVSLLSILALFSGCPSCDSSALASVTVPPYSLWPPSPAFSTGYPPLCPPAQIKEHCQQELPHSSTFVRTHCQKKKQRRFRNKQNPKVYFNSKLPQIIVKINQTPILEMLPDIICQMPDSK